MGKRFFKGGSGGGGGGKRFRRNRSLSEYNKIKGILYTCSTGKEYDASQEAINLMTEYSEEMIEELEDSEEFVNDDDDHDDNENENSAKKSSETDAGSENKESDDAQQSNKSSSESNKSRPIDPTDVSKHLEQEVNRLKEEKLFEALDTGVQGMIFIRINHRLLCPVKLLTHMFEKFMESELNINCRFIQRCIPVTSTSHAKLDNFKQMVDHQMKKYTKGLNYDDPNTVRPMFVLYGVVYKAVYSTNSITKQNCLDTVTPAMPRNHVVDLKKPNVVIFVYVIKSVATFSIVTGYSRLLEFNINSVRKMHDENRKARMKEQEEESSKKESVVSSTVASDVIESEFPQQSEPVTRALHLEEEPNQPAPIEDQATTQPPSDEGATQEQNPTKKSSAAPKKKKKGQTFGGVRLF